MVRDYGEDIQFVGIGSVDTSDHIEDFISFYGLRDVPTVIDVDGDLRVSVGIPGHPAWALIDEDGVARLALGTVYRPALIRAIEELIAG